jgi:threonine dehydrogenase-like Zn-dependent dehydrogenase
MILEKLSKDVVLGDGGMIFELERRGYVRAGPYTPEVVVEDPQVVRQLHVDFARAGGRIVLAGVKGFKPIPNFVSDKIVLKELTIKGAIGVTRSGYASAIRLLERRRHPVEMMHTHDFALEDAELAIKTLARQIDGEESIHSCLFPEF